MVVTILNLKARKQTIAKEVDRNSSRKGNSSTKWSEGRMVRHGDMNDILEGLAAEDVFYKSTEMKNEWEIS